MAFVVDIDVVDVVVVVVVDVVVVVQVVDVVGDGVTLCDVVSHGYDK